MNTHMSESDGPYQDIEPGFQSGEQYCGSPKAVKCEVILSHHRVQWLALPAGRTVYSHPP